MQYLYKCSKCGKVYEDENEAWNCETFHADINVFDRLSDILEQSSTWKTGVALPSSIRLASQKVYMPNGDDKVFYGLYELKRELTPTEIEEAETQYKMIHGEEN